MTYILPATVERAKRTQRVHDAAEGTSRCKGCWSEGLGSVQAGTCWRYVAAEAILVAYRQQQRPRGRAAVRPGQRLWARTPDRPQAGPLGGLAGAAGRHSRG